MTDIFYLGTHGGKVKREKGKDVGARGVMKPQGKPYFTAERKGKGCHHWRSSWSF